MAPTNITLGVLIATINGSIALISLPGIFTGSRVAPCDRATSATCREC
ncbi:hypothetical protein ACWCRF_14005 [Streptomyces sp. NPDC002405]